AGAYRPATRNASAPTPNTVATDLTDIGSPAPCEWLLGGTETFLSAETGLGGAGGTFGGGGGQVITPSLMTVRPRIASSSMLTLITPSFVLHNSSATRNRLVA